MTTRVPRIRRLFAAEVLRGAVAAGIAETEIVEVDGRRAAITEAVRRAAPGDVNRASRQGSRAWPGDPGRSAPVRRPRRVGGGVGQSGSVGRSDDLAVPGPRSPPRSTASSTPPDPDVMVTASVEFDSRKLTPGSLVVAFAGASADGHDFRCRRDRDGAVAMLGPARGRRVPSIIVADPLVAAGQTGPLRGGSAAGYHDRRADRLVRQDDHKDYIAQLLARLGPTVAPAARQQRAGPPVHRAQRPPPRPGGWCWSWVARGAGHITYLTDVAPLKIGAVINVGVAHIGEFGSVEAIAAAKGELGGGAAGRRGGHSECRRSTGTPR